MPKSLDSQLERTALLLDAVGGEPLAGSGFESETYFVAEELWEGEVRFTPEMNDGEDT